MASERQPHVATWISLALALAPAGCLADYDPATLTFACRDSSECAAGWVCASIGAENVCARPLVEPTDVVDATEDTVRTDATEDTVNPDATEDTVGSCGFRNPVVVGDTPWVEPCPGERVTFDDARTICRSLELVASTPRWRLGNVADLVSLTTCGAFTIGPAAGCVDHAKPDCPIADDCRCEPLPDGACYRPDGFPSTCGAYWITPGAGTCERSSFDLMIGAPADTPADGLAFVICVDNGASH